MLSNCDAAEKKEMWNNKTYYYFNTSFYNNIIKIQMPFLENYSWLNIKI